MGDRWDRLWDLFGRASDMGEAERLELLASVRENDPELGGELEEMLAQHARHGVLDNAPLVGSDEFEDPLLGQTIGPYRIESLLGQGGMGAVYLASQSEPVQRSVALKLIRDSLDPQAVLPRFERERRALALMQHSAIAAIYDAGQTDTGRPYFVMELVEGKPITAFCDDARLGVKQRVQLFQQVCRGVHHAHQKGIIHRDLKPSNILVTEQDGDPCPKVIDFGIARAVRTVEDGEARQTRVGTVVGTPEYMSPEQADSRGADVDTRSDVYSLSCVLYELLTGALPHDPDTLRRADAATLQRILDEERPPTPSQKLDTVRESETIARTRNTSRGTLREQLRGDLDWIVMKGLENDRSRRYESAAALADDLARHLEHRPVEATPPSLSYVTGKFIRRYRVAVGATVAVVLGMLIALGGVTVGLLRTAQALKEANRQRQKASHVQSVLEQAFTQIDPLEAQGRDTSLLVEILVATGERIDRELANNPDAAGELHLTVARAYKMLGDSEGTERHAGRAVELLGEVLGEQAPQTLAARNLLALAYWEQGRHAEAEALHRSVYESRARALGPEHADTLTSLNNLALAVKNRGDVQTAAELFERCLADRRRTLGATHPSTVIVMSNLARAREDLEQFEEAEELMREIVRIETESFGKDDARTLHSRDILGGVVASAGRLEEAEQLHREALAGMRRVYGERHPTTLGSMYNLGKLQIKAARFDEAETTLRSVSDIVREDHGDDHRYARLAGQHLAQAICAQPGRQAEGLAEFDRLQRLDTASRDEPDPDWAMVDLRHGECLVAAGRNDAAELRLRQALTDLTRLHGADNRRSRQAADALSRLARSD